MQESVTLRQAESIIIERSRNLAEQLIIKRGHDIPPFQPFDFTSFLPIKDIIPTNLGELGGMLLRHNDGYIIKVNSNDIPSRQNFSIAHEIGHILLDELSHKTTITPMAFRSYNPQANQRAITKFTEHLCDLAAAELLMPESVFQKHLNRLGISITTIEELSSMFRVSRQASAIRTAEISNEPCMVLLWKLNPKSQSKVLNLAWHRGPGRNKMSKEWYLPGNNRVIYPSSLHTAYEQNSIVKCHRIFKTNSGNKRIPMESKGFDRNEKRYVLSVAFVNR